MKCNNALCLEPAAAGDQWCRGCRYDFDVSRVTRKPAKRGGPFGGETGGDVSSSAEERRELRSTPGRPLIVACIDPWAEVKP